MRPLACCDARDDYLKRPRRDDARERLISRENAQQVDHSGSTDTVHIAVLLPKVRTAA